MNKLFFVFILLSSAFIIGCEKEEPDTADCNPATSFSADVLPLINTSCGNATCHGAGATNGAMTNYTEVKSYVDNGKFNQRVLVTQDMPVGSSLSAAQLASLQCWIDDGAQNN